MTTHTGLFSALLKHWRSQRGLSQLDLALAADVSARHISFLETGRSSPSAEMILKLAATLDVPLRHVNAMLEAGHPAHYPQERDVHGLSALPDEILHALELMKRHHDPYPFIVLDAHYNVLDLNAATLRLFELAMPDLFGAMMADGAELPKDLPQVNLVHLTFAPGGAHTCLINFDEVGRALLWRLQREVLASPEDAALRALLEETLKLPTISPNWREVDLMKPSLPLLLVRMKCGQHELRFVTLITAFQAPQSVLLDELRIETWIPADDETATIYRGLMQHDTRKEGEP